MYCFEGVVIVLIIIFERNYLMHLNIFLCLLLWLLLYWSCFVAYCLKGVVIVLIIVFERNHFCWQINASEHLFDVVLFCACFEFVGILFVVFVRIFAVLIYCIEVVLLFERSSDCFDYCFEKIASKHQNSNYNSLHIKTTKAICSKPLYLSKLSQQQQQKQITTPNKLKQ